jgi:hypothetical protein
MVSRDWPLGVEKLRHTAAKSAEVSQSVEDFSQQTGHRSTV